MKTILKLDTAMTPDGCEMELHQHDRDFVIKVKGNDLMGSRQHESELELARLSCVHLKDRKEPSVLIGGLGLGYTLRETLDVLGEGAEVVVSELLDAVIEWNRKYLGELTNHPLTDKRVDLQQGDVVAHINKSKNRYDAILLDIDNGPGAFTDSGNQRLYEREGIMACRAALREHGCLAVWSAQESKSFERLLLSCKFHFRRYHVAAYKGGRQLSKIIWLASEDKSIFPPGAVESRNIGH